MSKTYAEWRAEQMKNPEVADEVYRNQCATQIELCRMLRGWSIKKLAKRLGVSKATVKAVIAGNVQLSVHELFQWLHIMGFEAKIMVNPLECDTCEALSNG